MGTTPTAACGTRREGEGCKLADPGAGRDRVSHPRKVEDGVALFADGAGVLHSDSRAANLASPRSALRRDWPRTRPSNLDFFGGIANYVRSTWEADTLLGPPK